MTTTPFLSRKTGQFSYFAQQLRNWRWQMKHVLDFGGNVGNILRDPSCNIRPRRYWCIDVIEESVARGAAEWPDAHWEHYNRYCFYFNPHGVPRLPVPDLGRKFDYIVVNSVFPNTDLTDMLQLVEQLRSQLSDDGALAFTFMDPNYHPWKHYDVTNFTWRLREEREEISSEKSREIRARIHDAEWFILVNGEDLYVETEEIGVYPPERQKTHHTFYTTAFMRRLFPDAEIREPVDGEKQHCCVMRKR